MEIFSSRNDFIPSGIEQVGGEALRVRWHDGHGSSYAAAFLRRNCPCAGCVDEASGRRILAPEDVPADVRILNARVVGNYALGLAFSDGHGSGIYTFEALRRLCPCPECAQAGPREP